MNEWNKRAKDCSPEETVKKIEALLSKQGFNLVYNEIPGEVPGLYSSRVEAKMENGLSFGANGKGSTREFAKASAYAELIERIQNTYVNPYPYVWSRYYLDRFMNINNKTVPFDEEAHKKDSYLHLYIEEIAKNLPIYTISKTKALEMAEYMLKQLSFDNDLIFYELFYDYKDKTEVKYPVSAVNFLYSSNGMAAGNTLEEAIVQGACEIFERYVQKKFLSGEVVFADIPREAVFKSEMIKNLTEEIESQGFKVLFKDASMGGKYPVVVTVIINQDTGLSSFKFGSHPSMEIALERTFTETMQGRHKLLDSTINEMVYNRTEDSQKTDTFNATKRGISPLPIEAMIGKPSYEYSPWGIEGALDNKAMANYLLDIFVREGYHPLIKDQSWLGFPTVWIIVPFYSEARDISFAPINESVNVKKSAEIFRHLPSITDNEVETLKRFVLGERVSFIANTPERITFSYLKKMNEHPDITDFTASCCFYYQGNLKDALKYMTLCHKSCKTDRLANAASKYLEGRVNGYSHEYALKAIDLLFDSDLKDRIDKMFRNPKDIFVNAFPVCNNENCENCKYKCECDNMAAYDTHIKLWKLKLENETNEKLFDL